MQELQNTTPFKAAIVPWLDASGLDYACVVIKATYSLSGRSPALSLADVQVPILSADELHGEPGTSSIRYAADLGPLKPATDVVLVGQAHAPGGSRCHSLDVGVQVGRLKKSARVFGDRRWTRALGSWRVTPPEPFAVMPLIYERAFGGSDPHCAAPHPVELRNPVGTGFAPSGSADRLDGLPLPNLEDADDLIRSVQSHPAPVGFGFIAPHWLPRRNWVGTYDAEWQRTRCPFLPENFSMRFFNAAPAGLTATPHLQGGEPVRLCGVSAVGELSFRLPSVVLQVSARLRSQPLAEPCTLDTVVLEPERARVLLTWKAMLPCRQQYLSLNRVTVRMAQGERPTG